MSTESFVYLLECSNGNTYVGATVDLDRRLRQHNKEIQGGARATGAQVAKGLIWKRHCFVSGFPDWTAALQFEWRWKQLSRKRTEKKPIDRRMAALDQLLTFEKSTEKAVPFELWSTPPIIHWERE